MTPDVQAIAAPIGFAPYTALVLEPRLSDALFMISVLTALGFHVTVADTFKDAKSLLAVQPPVLLVTELRLAEYNGLHLVLRAKSVSPGIAAVITSQLTDPVLQQEAERMGATYLQKPVTADEFKAAVIRTLCHQPDAPPVRAPFERRTADRRVADAHGVVADDQVNRRHGERRRVDLARLHDSGVA